MSIERKKGYSKKMRERLDAHEAANSENVGVVLGHYCCKLNIPITDVAGFFDVSKPTIYGWFSGKAHPRSQYVDRINKVVEKLRLKQQAASEPKPEEIKEEEATTES